MADITTKLLTEFRNLRVSTAEFSKAKDRLILDLQSSLNDNPFRISFGFTNEILSKF